MGIIAINSPTYAAAKSDMYQNFGQPVVGKSIALANVTEDRSFLFLILFSIERITVTADFVEFTGSNTNAPATK